MTLPTKEERIRRKKVMQAAGISVPNTDSSWGPWWEQQWQKAITHEKYYPVSFTGAISHGIDALLGNTTYQAEPQPRGGTISATDNSISAQIDRTLRNWYYRGDPIRDLTLLTMPDPSKPVKAGKAVVKAVPQVIKSIPKLFTKKGATQAAKIVGKEIPKAVTADIAGRGVDQVSKQITGKSWAENASDKMSDVMGFHVEPIFGELTNPGYYGGYKYGNFVTNNYSNLGRYTLDNLRPWNYSFDKEQLIGLGKTFTQPLYKKPPTFFDHRPKWYITRDTDLSKTITFLEPRLENGANWAQIPESEIPRFSFTRNPDGTVSPQYIKKKTLLTKDDFSKPGETITEMDDITPGTVGGVHSDYTYLGDDPYGYSNFEYYDRQRLNPQWVISDWIKNKFNLSEGSRTYNLVHKIGGIDLNPILGYKPFDIKFKFKGRDNGMFQTDDLQLIP